MVLLFVTLVSSKEILELKSPFGLGQSSSPIYTYPFFGEDQLLKLPIPIGTSENILDALEIVICVNISISQSSTAGSAEYYLGISDANILGEASETICGKLKELAEAAGFDLKCFTDWKEFQKIYSEKSGNGLGCCIGDYHFLKSINSSEDIYELMHDNDSDSDNNNNNYDNNDCKKNLRNGFYNRLQILLPFFIEAATPINVHDPKWSIYLSIDMSVCKGLLNTYSYFRFPEGNRIRISQVFVFPRFQNHQLGSRLYRQVCKKLRAAVECVEICVEDPTDGFERIRGSCDWQDANDLNLWKYSDGGDNSKLRETLKLTEEQSVRLINLNESLNLKLKNKNKKAKLQVFGRVNENENENDITTKTNTNIDPEIALRKQIKRWLLKKYKKDLPERGEERISKLNDLYEVEIDEFIKPIVKFLCK